MNRLFVAQFWHQIWSPKREPKTTNFLPRNPDTFQPNFEQNLTKKSKKLERRKRYCKYPKKRHDHVLQTGSTSWPPSRRLRGILTARKRNTHPLALWLKPRPHTLPLATPLLHYLATVRLSFWAQVVSFGNFCWSQLCATILVFVWITISSPAGRFFFWPAGRILSPFLVPVLGTVFGPCFGHQIVPRYKDY